MEQSEALIYQKIIVEQLQLQELQVGALAACPDALGPSGRIKKQRKVLSQLWRQANALKRFNPLV